MTSNSGLQGKTVVITGAGSGVGRAAAEAFARAGCSVVLAARGVQALDDVREICHKIGAIAIVVPTDMGVLEQVEHLVHKALELNGRINVWVNNAGIMATGRFEDMSQQAIEKVIQTNLLGYVYASRAVLPIFKKQGQGVLINNISIGGLMPAPYSTAYTAAKFGAAGLTQSLQAEVSDQPDIHVVGLYPGMQKSTGNSHSAKYSGLNFKVPPTAANPRKLAESMVQAALRPRKKVFTDAFGVLASTAYSLAPGLMRATMSTAVRGIMHEDKGTDTDGNIFTPSTAPLQVYGETMVKVPAVNKSTLAVAAGAAAVLTLALLTGRKNS